MFCVKSQIPLGLSRHVTTRTTCRACLELTSQHAYCQLLSFSSVNFRFNLDYLHYEPRRRRFSAITEE